ncbi:tRNA uridine-5-carboxymethylaminomethyl(34) synthesis GTPase MnmE [Pseudoruegeria sp. SK021]|uniref:tRNA uridine-5-carboxymethylaminomethyl(34) synthesis GTPase MnmE n=1 Tax=Pseudoruegeria sp. SK021 TaxID=1933035 RepID=UPI000A224FD7|nr:tRNA uridine-5-carboxymethylaminomethyl(34) synthesis GTPase MnmE [Pseudoruegeria sp. SK021]OSP55340.1 tRNA uridine-5-carboxymethylaminomethyl(34) synthesis GTPase MnmE [Pseudoruegeria sp. SK021]
MDTIYALASAQGKAGVAVVRVSGPNAFLAVSVLAGRLPAVRRASLMSLRDQEGGLLDHALVLVFAKGGSFTGEESAEFQLHGSRATVSAVLRALSDIDGLRLANPGEFTRRALENGRMDLTEVEGLADLIDAETEAQRRQALRVFSGALGARTSKWRANLVRALALLEVTIDFSDEDVPVDVFPEVLELVTSVRQDISEQVAGVAVAERIRDGFEVAIMGPPNIGKSTLLNALAGRDAALTSEIAGTTRDVIEVRMDLHGLPVTFLDTAGLRKTDDKIEALGIERALERADAADIRVVLSDSKSDVEVKLSPGDIILKGKADLSMESSDGISGRTGQGVSDLLARISNELMMRTQSAGLAVHERHRIAMTMTVGLLMSVEKGIVDGSSHTELAAEDLRHAVTALDALVGKVDIEQVLDEIFRSFCLGK